MDRRQNIITLLNSKKYFKYKIIPNMKDTNIITKDTILPSFKRNKRDELSPICIPWCNHRSPSLQCVVASFYSILRNKNALFSKNVADASYMTNWSFGRTKTSTFKNSHYANIVYIFLNQKYMYHLLLHNDMYCWKYSIWLGKNLNSVS